MNFKAIIFVVVGTPGSGKDLLIQAVNDMGLLHCRIVPKHTNRERQADDSNEMICVNDDGYDLENCEIVYTNYNNRYGIKNYDVGVITSNNITISENDCSHNEFGMEFVSPHGYTIENNSCTNNTDTGIYLIRGVNNLVVSNDLSWNNNYGLHLSSSGENTVDNNTISNNLRVGIYFIMVIIIV